MVLHRADREGDDQQANTLFERLLFLVRGGSSGDEGRPSRKTEHVLVFRQRSWWI